MTVQNKIEQIRKERKRKKGGEKMPEDWDSNIPKKVAVDSGKYTVVIEGIDYVKGEYGRKVLQIETDQGQLVTGAWNVINFLRDNKPVINKKFSFEVTGEGTGRRFKNMAIE